MRKLLKVPDGICRAMISMVDSSALTLQRTRKAQGVKIEWWANFLTHYLQCLLPSTELKAIEAIGAHGIEKYK